MRNYLINRADFKSYSAVKIAILTFISILIAVTVLMNFSYSAYASDTTGENAVLAGKKSTKNGFVKESDGTHYYKNGKSVTGRHKISKKVYYFDKNGVMRKKKWYTSKYGNTFYFGKKGYAVTGRHTINGRLYYFNRDGVMLKNKWYTSKYDNTFYFGKKGCAVTGFHKIKGKLYCFNKDGVMLKNRLYTSKRGNKYYFGKKGAAITGKIKVGNRLYYANKKGVIYRTVDGNKKMVALTFDDGPSAYTPLVLDTLDKYDAVATFFVVGNRVPTYSEYVKRAYNLGCEIATHTYSHAYLSRLSADQIKQQVQSGADAIKRVTGDAPVIMRPPGGCVNSTVSANVGLPMIIWSVDTLDWKTRSTPTTISRVVDGACDGAIILVHDLHQSTCIAAQTFIPELIQNGYQLVTVSEMAELRGVKLEAGKSYYSFKR